MDLRQQKLLKLEQDLLAKSKQSINMGKQPPLRMDLYTAPQRVAYKIPPTDSRDGIGSELRNVGAPSIDIPKKLRNTDNSMFSIGKRPAYYASAPNSRLYGVHTSDELAQKVLQEEGIKIRLSDKTISNIFETKVPETRTIINPDGTKSTVIVRDAYGQPRMVNKYINIDKLTTMLSDTDASIKAMLTKGFADNMTKLTFFDSLFQDMALTASLTESQLRDIATIVSTLIPEDYTSTITGKTDIITQPIWRSNKGSLIGYFVSVAEARGLTPHAPFYDFKGNPVALSTADKALSANASANYVIDAKTSRYFTDIADLEAERKSPGYAPIIEGNKRRAVLLQLVANAMSSRQIIGTIQRDVDSKLSSAVSFANNYDIVYKTIAEIVRKARTTEASERKYISDRVEEFYIDQYNQLAAGRRALSSADLENSFLIGLPPTTPLPTPPTTPPLPPLPTPPSPPPSPPLIPVAPPAPALDPTKKLAIDAEIKGNAADVINDIYMIPSPEIIDAKGTTTDGKATVAAARKAQDDRWISEYPKIVAWISANAGANSPNEVAYIEAELQKKKDAVFRTNDDITARITKGVIDSLTGDNDTDNKIRDIFVLSQQEDNARLIGDKKAERKARNDRNNLQADIRKYILGRISIEIVNENKRMGFDSKVKTDWGYVAHYSRMVVVDAINRWRKQYEQKGTTAGAGRGYPGLTLAPSGSMYPVQQVRQAIRGNAQRFAGQASATQQNALRKAQFERMRNAMLRVPVAHGNFPRAGEAPPAEVSAPGFYEPGQPPIIMKRRA